MNKYKTLGYWKRLGGYFCVIISDSGHQVVPSEVKVAQLHPAPRPQHPAKAGRAAGPVGVALMLRPPFHIFWWPAAVWGPGLREFHERVGAVL